MIVYLIQGKQTKPEEMRHLHELLRNEMVAAQLRQKEYYDLQRKPDPNLQSGDMVWLLPRNIKNTWPSKKLDYKNIGPLEILAKIGTSAYKLALPPSMAIPNTFHISLLEPYQDNRFPSQIKEPPPPIQIEGEDEYELDEIIDSGLHYNKLQYRAKWKGYSPEHDKVWYPAENLNNAEHTVQGFHRRYPRKPGVDTCYDQQFVLSTSPVVKQERRSRTPENDATRVAQNTTPTSPEYSGSPRRDMAHASMNWTDCTDDGCQIHLGEKQGSGWYPQFTRRSRKPSVAHDHDWRQEMEANPGEDWVPQQQPRRGNARRAHHEITGWEHCFNDNCNEQRWEKVDAGYYPRQVGEKGALSQNDRREDKKRRAVRTRLEGEGSEKTVVPEVETLEKMISDLRSQLDCAAQTIIAKENDLE